MRKFTLLFALLVCAVGFSQERGAATNVTDLNRPATQKVNRQMTTPSSDTAMDVLSSPYRSEAVSVEPAQRASTSDMEVSALGSNSPRFSAPSGTQNSARAATSDMEVASLGSSNPQFSQPQAVRVSNQTVNSNYLTGVFSYEEVSANQYTVVSSNSPIHVTQANRSGGVAPYTDMTSFQNDAGTLVTEDFTGGAQGGVNTCGPTISSAGDGCFPAGEIEDGFNVASTNAGDTVLLNTGFLGNTIEVVGANTFLEATVINFPGDGAVAVGAINLNNLEVDTTWDVYDTGGTLLDSFTVNAPVLTENFFGVISSDAIGSIEIRGANDSGELIGNLMFELATPGGGGGGPCDLVGPGNAFENGKSFTQNLGRIVAHDFTVPAGEDSMLTEVIANAFIGATGSGVNAAFVDFYVWGDAGGAPDPGNLVASEAGLVPSNQAVVGTNFGFDVWAVTLDIADVMLAGDAGSDTTYWIGLSLEATDASNVFWENSTAGLIGLGEAYDDGAGGGFVIDNTLEGVYTMTAECSPIGGGGGGPCDLAGPSNAFENGKSFTQNLGRIVAHDFTVSAGEDSMLTEITANAFIGATGSGVNAAFVDVYVWGDAGGAPDPGNLVASEAGLVPSNQAVVGTNFGFDVWAVTLDIADVMLAGDAGSDTTYWIGLSLEATDASNVFWENSTAGLIGLGEAYDDGAGGGFVIDNTLEGVYNFAADCTPIGGGGGGPCNLAGPSNGFENGKSFTQNLGRIVAHDFTVAAGEDAMLTEVIANAFIGATGSGVNAAFVDFYVWGDAGGAPDPGNLVASEAGLVPTNQAVVGTNFGFDVWAVTLDVADVMLAGDGGSDTTYWIGLSLEATDASNVFWENSTAGLVGLGEAYDDGAGGGFVIDNTLEGVYDFIADCTPMGGGGPCNLVGPGNAFENGKSFTQNLGRIVAHDFTVSAGENAMLMEVTANAFIGATGSGVNAAFVDVYVWGDAGGAPDPGNLIASEAGLVPSNQAVVGTNFGFDVWAVTLDIADVMLNGSGGADTTYWIGLSLEATDASNVFWENSTAGLIGLGEAYDDGAGGGFVIDNTLEGVYEFVADCSPLGVTNDQCEGATPVACGDVVVGTTADNTDTGGNPAPDEWYSFTGTGSAEIVTVSLCDGGTDYDSLIRVFDACGGNEIAVNDDSCGLQSELTFGSDGTSTYYIMIEGFASNSGNFSMAISCVPAEVNDQCEDALPIACGDTISGSTINASFDNAPECVTTNTAPGVWYIYDDQSGLTTDILLSTCSANTDYDTKISVYSGDCGNLVCVNGNDDSANCTDFQSEVEFQSDGNTTYYILVHGFGSAVGNFELSMSCDCLGPVNDDISNSNDADEVGFPYVDSDVPAPCATTEDATPPDCDNAGVQGFWYNFTPEMDGLATCEVTAPAGFTSVTFYEAPSESASEEELILIDYFDNQCVPQNDASVPVVAGQAYYVYVANTGGITDVVIDGTFFLGANDNQIEGFTFAPNPADNMVTLSSVELIEQVELYNVLGQKVIDLSTNALTQNVDVSSLAVGAYIMKVTVNGQVGTYKLIKR